MSAATSADAAHDARLLPGGARHAAVTAFYYRESDLLDENRFAEWLALLDEEISYEMPVRTTEMLANGDGFSAETSFFAENHSSMATRVERLATSFAWAEVPPSRTRHFVTNVVIDGEDAEGTLSVRANVLLNRTRADGGNQTLTASRRDVLVPAGENDFRIRRRRVLLDQTVVSATNLSVFF